MRTLQVYDVDINTGALTMKFPHGTPSEVSGVQTLLQNIVLFLRTKPESDAFTPERGSILGDPSALARIANKVDQVKVSVTDAVDRCQEFIIAQQSDQRGRGQVISPDATLTQLEVNNIYQGEDPTSILCEILVYTEGNKQYFLTV